MAISSVRKKKCVCSHVFMFFYKYTTNGPLRTGHKNVVSTFQRQTLRIAHHRPFPLFQSGPGWPSSYGHEKGQGVGQCDMNPSIGHGTQ